MVPVASNILVRLTFCHHATLITSSLSFPALFSPPTPLICLSSSSFLSKVSFPLHFVFLPPLLVLPVSLPQHVVNRQRHPQLALSSPFLS